MPSPSTLPIRRDIVDLQNDYTNGNKKPLEDLMRAWQGIQAKSPTDQSSFFWLGGLHGEPFRGEGATNSAYWGGWCNHGNVLFPTWHRVYVYVVEKALQSIPGCADVMMPYWDETSQESLLNGVPWAFTNPTFELDGVTIPNPLSSFQLPLAINDGINGDDPNYSKPQGYTTVRYPLSGLVGTPADQQTTIAHNAQYTDPAANTALLNANLVTWLNSQITVDGQPVSTGVNELFEQCLNAPNYTLFSNTTSAGQNTGPVKITPLESPHNSIHLATGGYDVITGPNAFDGSLIEGANGDMGENDTAGLDPIFYFHHCNIDRVFWLWQQKTGNTNSLEIIAGDPGANASTAKFNGQGPTPSQQPDEALTMETLLAPFINPATGITFTSNDCVNIETQLGFTYSPGSLSSVQPKLAAARPTGNYLNVTGISRAKIRGSFVINGFATVKGVRHFIGSEAILSRWSVEGCANCQKHLEATAKFDLSAFKEEDLKDAKFEVVIQTRDGIITQEVPNRLGQNLTAKMAVY